MSNEMKDTAVVIAVPARLSSSRLPGKVMADIAGKPMLRHVLERCRQVRGVHELVPCCDSEVVLDALRTWGFDALATSEKCSSGSERLASVVAELVRAGERTASQTLVINVQGDQPCLDPGIVEKMICEAR